MPTAIGLRSRSQLTSRWKGWPPPGRLWTRSRASTIGRAAKPVSCAIQMLELLVFAAHMAALPEKSMPIQSVMITPIQPLPDTGR